MKQKARNPNKGKLRKWPFNTRLAKTIRILVNGKDPAPHVLVNRKGQIQKFVTKQQGQRGGQDNCFGYPTRFSWTSLFMNI